MMSPSCSSKMSANRTDTSLPSRSLPSNLPSTTAAGPSVNTLISVWAPESIARWCSGKTPRVPLDHVAARSRDVRRLNRR